MKPSEMSHKPAETVTLRPVFRYSEGPARGRRWIWVTGAALLLAVIATLFVPQVL